MSSSQEHSSGGAVEHQVGMLSDDVWDRYRAMREESRDRMDADELTNTEFVSVLLDVYALHLEDSP